jgi:hypothetical protein
MTSALLGKKWVLTNANAAETNGLTCKQELEIIYFRHPYDDRAIQTLLSFRDRTPSGLIARSSKSVHLKVRSLFYLSGYSQIKKRFRTNKPIKRRTLSIFFGIDPLSYPEENSCCDRNLISSPLQVKK